MQNQFIIGGKYELSEINGEMRFIFVAENEPDSILINYWTYYGFDKYNQEVLLFGNYRQALVDAFYYKLKSLLMHEIYYNEYEKYSDVLFDDFFKYAFKFYKSLNDAGVAIDEDTLNILERVSNSVENDITDTIINYQMLEQEELYKNFETLNSNIKQILVDLVNEIIVNKSNSWILEELYKFNRTDKRDPRTINTQLPRFNMLDLTNHKSINISLPPKNISINVPAAFPDNSDDDDYDYPDDDNSDYDYPDYDQILNDDFRSPFRSQTPVFNNNQDVPAA